MKVVQFTIPVAVDRSIVVQDEELPHFYNHLHRHKEIQITWIIEGTGTLLAGNYMHPFKAGEVYLLGANQPHLFKSDPVYFDQRRKKKVKSLSLFFNPVQFTHTVLSLPETKQLKRFIEQSNMGLQIPKASVQKIIAEMLMVKEAKQGYILTAFLHLLQTMSSIKGNRVLASASAHYRISDTDGLRMNDVYRYTMEHYTDQIKLQEIAGVAHLTVQAFCRYFKKHTRKTYISFVNEIRINEACKKMTGGEVTSISSIAYETGFSSAVSFNRVFKKITGISPTRYIKDYSEQVN